MVSRDARAEHEAYALRWRVAANRGSYEAVSPANNPK